MSEFIEIIEFTDENEKNIIHKVPEKGSLPIKMGAQLIVRESQRAIFFRDGRALDVFGPGRYTLSTANLPLLTKMLSLPFGFNSPFRAEVIFVSTKVFTNLKWGTKNPIMLKDKELGVINIRAFGNYSLKIVQPLIFVNTLVGMQAIYDTKPLEDFFRDIIVSRFTDLIGETLTSIFDLPQYFDEISVMAKARIYEDFKKYGIEVKDFVVSSINPPEEVQQMIDEKSGMNALGDVNEYMKFKAARAMGEAASSNGNGDTSSGMGLGLGAGLGMLLPGMMYGNSTNVKNGLMECPYCHNKIQEGSKFCPECGKPLLREKRTKVCPQCGSDVDSDAKFCPQCGYSFEKKVCPSCGAKVEKGDKFCPECGTKLN